MSRPINHAMGPIGLDCPPAMARAVAEVLAGEYESGYSAGAGHSLTVLDIGANVGSFALWASTRWPGCSIHCYEPHPGTFTLLSRNVANRQPIACHNAAVYPLEQATAPFWGRYDGDGEAGLVIEAERTFQRLEPRELLEVSVIHPRVLPSCDVMKIDVEGAESAILRAMNLEGVSLILIEYQNRDNRAAIEDLLQETFQLAHEDRFQWSELLPGSRYRADLEGDIYGHLFFVNRRHNRLLKDEGLTTGDRPQIEYSLRTSLGWSYRLRQYVKRVLGRIA